MKARLRFYDTKAWKFLRDERLRRMGEITTPSNPEQFTVTVTIYRDELLNHPDPAELRREWGERLYTKALQKAGL